MRPSRGRPLRSGPAPRWLLAVAGRPRARWLALVVVLLAVVTGALLVHPRKRPGGLVLPDPPAAPERDLLARMAAARTADPTPARLLGDYYADSAHPFAALWAYATALQAQPGDLPATLGLARALERTGFPEEAIARLRPLVDGKDEAVAQLAELYLQTGRPEAALRVVRGAGAAFASSKDGAVLEGRVREALGDARGAKAAYWRAVGQDAHDAEVRHRIGLLALSQGESFAAQQAFGAAHVLAPAEARYDVDLGRAFAASARPEERRRAPEFYSEAMGRDPRCGPAHYEAGAWYVRQSRWPEALEQLQMAAALDPGDADAREQLAQALEAGGRPAEAHRQRGQADQARNLRRPALREYQAWAALDPNNPEAALQVAQASFDLERADEARALLEKARRQFPHDAALRERLIAFDILGHDAAPARRLCEEWLRAERVTLRWPSGTVQTLTGVAANREIVVDERVKG